MASGQCNHGNNKRSNRKHHKQRNEFGGENITFEVEKLLKDGTEEIAEWDEIVTDCCCHSTTKWMRNIVCVLGLITSLYFFLFGLVLLSSSLKVMAGCSIGQLIDGASNPLSNVMIGILVTVLFESSPLTIAVVVALAETGHLDVEQGIYIVMGANIGTTLTASLVALGQTMRSEQELRYGFHVASLHSMFNFLSMAIFFPLEVSTGFLARLSETIVESTMLGERSEIYNGFVEVLVAPLVNRIIISNNKIIKQVASDTASCEEFYPIKCDPNVEPSYEACRTGLIGCDEETGRCPAFFRESASIEDDKASGGICFVLSIFFLVASLYLMVRLINKLLMGHSIKVVYTVTSWNGYLAIVVGIGATLLVESSSAVTSLLVPLGAARAVPLETLFPLIIGSNIGTALYAVLSAWTVYEIAPLQVAMSHLLMNGIAALIWYPLPPLRAIPLWAARRLGKSAEFWRLAPLFWTIGMFLGLPLLLLGLGQLYATEQGAAIAITVFTSLIFASTVIWCHWYGGNTKFAAFVTRQCCMSTYNDKSTNCAENSDTVDEENQGLPYHSAGQKITQ